MDVRGSTFASPATTPHSRQQLAGTVGAAGRAGIVTAALTAVLLTVSTGHPVISRKRPLTQRQLPLAQHAGLLWLHSFSLQSCKLSVFGPGRTSSIGRAKAHAAERATHQQIADLNLGGDGSGSSRGEGDEKGGEYE